MADDERLREALVEIEQLREREAQSHRETRALLSGLECIHSDRTRADSIRALLKVITQALNCDHVMVFHNTDAGTQVTLADSPEFEGLAWETVGVPIDRGRRIVDVRTMISEDRDVPVPLRRFHSLLAEPIRILDGERDVLACLSTKTGLFTKRDAALLKRFCNIASEALAGLELEEHNAFLAAVIDGSSSAVAIGEVIDQKLSLTYVNKALEALNGFTTNEAIGRDDSLFWHGDSARLDQFQDCIATFGTGSFRLANRRKDKTPFWNEVSVSPILPNEGPITQVVLTQTDVTRQVKAELDRDEARNRLEAALSSTREGFLALDSDGTILFANARFEEFVNMYEINWGVGWQFTDIWSRYLMKSGVPKDIALEKAGEYLERLLTKARSLEVRLPDRRTVLVNEHPITGGGAVIVASDVTQLKATEKTLLQRVTAIEKVQDGIAITDQSGRLTYSNPSLLPLWDIEVAEDLFGRRWTEFYEPADIRTLLQHLPSNKSEGAAQSEMRRRGEEGQVHLVSLTQVADLGHVVTVHDITRRLKAERSRAVLRDRLQAAQRQEALGQMAAGLAHDFNNLLSAITGSANLITEDDDASDANKVAATRITTAGYRAAELVNKLLDLGASEKAKEEIDLRALMEEALEFARPSMRPGATLSADLGSTPVFSYSSRTDLLQMTLNLIMNALDALPAHGGEISLNLDLNPELPAVDTLQLGWIDPEYDYVRIDVKDTGSGIPADKIGDIFTAYFTTKGAQGTGLGLAVVSSVIKANDGGLRILSQEGTGTTFEIYWPLASNSKPLAEVPKVDEETIDLTGIPIIVVDDDPSVAQVIARRLELSGAEVAVLDDPDFVLEVISDDPDSWGCLITDYDMPGMNGGELVEKVGKISPDLPKIVVTALARRLQDPRINSNTVDALLAKPVEPSKLLSAIRTAIDRRHKQPEE
ncbi:PAS domain-containing protein [Phaeobacter marinintestinus]|uniref:PAS domain-containing protein n=1 Tax=Falsiphaeobacter marinintestinus TaxID=1492905 RepID=UPI0011B40E20|nr:PAS domain S-box protein [Phaeobacter marinintestinus]